MLKISLGFKVLSYKIYGLSYLINVVSLTFVFVQLALRVNEAMSHPLNIAPGLSIVIYSSC